jgi:hypothetical protein
MNMAARRMVATVVSLLLAAGFVALPASSATAEGPSQLSLTKTASTPTVAPGETFSYNLEVGCSAVDVGTGCTNATLVDPVPAAFEVTGATVGPGLSAQTPVVNANRVTVVFDSPLQNPPGSIGLLASATGVVTITVRARTDLPFEDNAIAIDNTATLSATNQISPAVSTASVTPEIALQLATTATKSFSPRIATAVPGTATTLTIGASNDSNAAVDSITLTDPVDPTAEPNPFGLLQFSAFGALTFPEGADRVEVDAHMAATGWTTGAPAATPGLPAGVDATTVDGLRIIFTNSSGDQLPAGATASIQLDLIQRPDVADLTVPTPVRNSVQSTVTLGDASASGTANASYAILLGTVRIGATKSFSPDAVVEGGSTTVTLGGTNETIGTLTQLQFTEPTQATDDPFAGGFPPGTTFIGFTDGVRWPTGATSATVHYYYTDGTDESPGTTVVDTLPGPGPGKTPTRFVVTFDGSIAPGSSASVPFAVQTPDDFTDSSRAVTDTVTVDGTATNGTTGEADASDVLTVYATRLAVTVGKQIRPGEILAGTGELVTVSLPAAISQFPASTTDADRIVVQDPPGTPPVLTDWWNHFNATAITQTEVPAGATLTIRYWNGDAWIDLPGAVDIPGPQLFSINIPLGIQDDIEGLQFVYTSPDGFPPGTSVQPNVTMSLRDELRDGSGPASGGADTIENCASSSASSGPVSGEADTPSPCPTVSLIPGDSLPGADDFIGKTWVGPKVITARTADQAPVRLNWSTGGRSNLSSMVVSDPAAPATTSIDQSVFDAFDLVSIPPISADQDPELKFDQIQAVELYDGTTWSDAANDPCPTACDGTFPGLELTAGEQASTIGVRLTYAESPTRAATSVGDPAAPAVGSGVARSIGNDRAIVLDFRIRDDVRDPVTTPDPVVGTRFYNTGEAGAVSNTASATGTSSVDGSIVTDTAADTIRILDAPLNVTTSKTWTGGPLGVPQAGTAPSLYPSARVRINATNATAANVDQLEIADPASPASTRPFDEFDLLRIVTVSVPAGVTSTTVELTSSSAVTTQFTRNQALALTAAQLADVVRIRVLYDGRITAGATANLTFDTRLRAAHRSDPGSPVTAAADSPIANIETSAISDEGGTPGGSPIASGSASMDLADGTISVNAIKTLTPSTQAEPDDSPVTMGLSAQPGGTVRAINLTITDDTGTFWNAFDYVGLATPLTLTQPIDRVEIDACVGRDFANPTLDCVASGGHWVDGTAQTQADANASPLPPGVAVAAVEGLRYTFSRADGGLFENPQSPLQPVSLSVQRRADLRSGGPVPSDLAVNSPAPGETQAGAFTNTMQADVVGAFANGDAPFTASDSDTATMHYAHAATAVVVRKSPSGVEQPGQVIPFTLTVTNDGAIAMTNPVITDRIPTDADGPQLVFDPFADPTGPGPYSYALSGAPPTPQSGPQLPTDPAVVTASVLDGGAQIRFTFPAGTVLEVGQTYTITIDLIFRPGLAGGVDVTNSFGVSADRAFDSCDGTLLVDGECSADTTVTEQVAGAIRGIKFVRATDTSLGVDQTFASVPCAADGAGFYSGPCLPITRPGDTEVWRLQLINTGTLPMDRMVAVDRLPSPGDTGALVNLPRGSTWRPILSGIPGLATAPAGATMTTDYTTDATPCTDDLATTGVACPAGAWNPYPGAVDPATVTALKFVVEFGTPIQPADHINIDVTTRTAAFVPGNPAADAPEQYPPAWNTVAVGGRVLNGGVASPTTETEGNKVGVELAVGPIEVEKLVTGAGAAFAPLSFTGTVECVSDGVALDPIPITVAPGTPTTVDNLPLGADCTFAEDASGATETSVTHATVGLEGDPIGIITATNRYDLAGLTVSKTVASAAANQDDQPVAYGPFVVDVACSFLGAPVYASGYSIGRPMSAELTNGGSATFVGLPAGASCVITEVDAKGATGTTVESTVGGATAGPVAGTTSTIELAPNIISMVTNSVLFTNTFNTGSLQLVKSVEGAGAADFGTGPFTLHVRCTLTDASGTRTVWDGDVVLGGVLPLQRTIDDIATGAVCTVTEPAAAGANATTIDPTTPVTIGDGSVVTVTVTNTFLTGALHVVKLRQGDGADLYGLGPFAVTLACTHPVDGRPAVASIPGGATRALSDANAYTADYKLLPAGARCVLVESARGAANGSTIEGADGARARATTIVAGETANLTVINTFTLGSLRVTKRVVGGTQADEGRTFVVHLECTRILNGRAVDVPIPGGADRSLSKATSLVALYEQLPTGARCSLTEVNSGGADDVTISPNRDDDRQGVVRVGNATTVDLAVVNDFDPPDVLAPTGSAGGPLLGLAAIFGAAGLLTTVLATRRRRRAGS